MEIDEVMHLWRAPAWRRSLTGAPGQDCPPTAQFTSVSNPENHLGADASAWRGCGRCPGVIPIASKTAVGKSNVTGSHSSETQVLLINRNSRRSSAPLAAIRIAPPRKASTTPSWLEPSAYRIRIICMTLLEYKTKTAQTSVRSVLL